LFISQPFSLKSFPSDHAALAFFFAYLLFKHNHSGWAFGLAGVVALGRVIVGVHYPFDVLAGAVIGLVFGFFTSEAMNIFKPRVLGSRVN
jgi:membrane-associated phospholipid phosphatase